MKTTKLTAVLLALVIAGGINLYGQNKTSKEKKKEQKTGKVEKQLKEQQEKLQLQEEDLRKVLEETKRIQEQEWSKVREAQLRVQKEAMKSYRKSMEQMRAMMDTLKIADSLKFPGFYFFSPDSVYFKGEDFMNHFKGEFLKQFDVELDKGKNLVRKNYVWTSSSEASSMEISKYIEDVDYSNDFTYEVPKGSRNISFSVSGNFSKGKMMITLVKPNGKTLQDIVITPSADVSWSHSLSWDEEDKEEYTGTWKIAISAKKATGNYRVSVRSR